MQNNSLKTLVEAARSILIVLPQDANFDSTASATSLYLALSQEEGKEINVYSPSPMIVEYNNLVGVNKVKNEIGNKNLAITFEDYNPQGIEKVSWDIDNGTFKLTVVPKVNVAPPVQEQVKISYAGVAADLVIMVGGSDENSFPVIKTDDLKSVNLAHVGTHEISVAGRTVASLDTAASSISEVVANLIKNANYKIEADLATNLLMGIETATDKFTSPMVTAQTFALISELMNAGGKRVNVNNDQPMTMNSIEDTGNPANVPSSWTEPKIFKGTSVS